MIGRYCYSSLLLAALSAVAPIGSSTAANSLGTIVVNRAEFQCFMKNLDMVPSESKGVYVDIGSCRATGVKVQRRFADSTPTPAGVERVLFIKPNHLACLKRYRRNLGKITVQRPDSNVALLIDPCAKAQQ